MSLPENTAKMLYQSGDWVLPGADDIECEGAAFHSPRPLFVKTTSLVRREWWPADDAEDAPKAAHWAWAPDAWLCGTCRDNLDILLQMLHATRGDLPWPVRREFGNQVRALAMKGWSWYAKHHLEPLEHNPGA